MPLQKNQLLTLRIERLSSDGSGVAHSPEGEAVFVPGTAPGDEAQVRIVKDCGRYAFGILDKLLTPSPDRIPVDCAVAGPCGGCSLRHMDYAAELRSKQESVADAFRRIGGLDVPVLDALPSPEVDRYRNKVQFPVGRDKNGAPCIGFYAGRTHRIVPCPDCKLQPGVLNDIGNALCSFFAAHGIQPYDEESSKGLVRHIFLRRGTHSGQIMVCLVCTRPKFPHSEELVAALREQFSDIASVLINVNAKKTNVILGEETVSLYGPGYIEDTLCGVPVRLGPLSFYQVNTLAAERLYGIAAEYAQLEPSDVLLDLYCGMGTIGLSMADRCRELIGVEIVPEAIDSAKANAARMGDAAMFSFHATKVFNTIEGGAVCYRDPDMGRRLYELKNFGIHGPEEVDAVGANAKMNEFCAAMGLCNLRHVDEEIAKRRAVVERYREHLEGVDGLRLNVQQPEVRSNYAYFPVVFDENLFGASRNEVMDALAQNGIGARKYFYPLTNTFECFHGKYDVDATPVALHVAKRVLTLPLYADLSMEDVDRICKIVLEQKL